MFKRYNKDVRISELLERITELETQLDLVVNVQDAQRIRLRETEQSLRKIMFRIEENRTIHEGPPKLTIVKEEEEEEHPTYL